MLIRDLSNEALAKEWNYWNDKIQKATSWGAALAAANEFCKECEREINRRKIEVKGFNS